jgi:chromosome partitioning protein
MSSSQFGLGSLENQYKIFSALHQNGLKKIGNLKKFANKPSYDKNPKTYSITEVADLIGITRVTIRDKEKKNDISYGNDSTPSNKGLKSDYTLNDIRILREYFGKGFFNGNVDRPKDLEPFIISVGMFKGGVGKTTHSSHLAAHCAIAGLKTLLIDLDPQASATLTMGYIPSLDLEGGETIYDTLINDPKDILNVIKPTHYHGLDIITSGLELQGADISLPNDTMNKRDELGSPLLRLKTALALPEMQKYDIIIMDLAPNHASVSLNALAADNARFLPINPTMLAFGSSVQFTETLTQLSYLFLNYKKILKEQDDPYNELPIIDDMENKIFKVLITNDENNKESQEATKAIKSLYGSLVLDGSMKHTIALPRTSNELALLYDKKRSEVRGAKESFERGLYSMMEMNDKILSIFKQSWGLEL